MKHDTEMLRWGLVARLSHHVESRYAELLRAEQQGAAVDRDAAFREIETCRSLVAGLVAGELDPFELAEQARQAAAPFNSLFQSPN